MQKINTISSLEGRAILGSIFQELRYEKQLSSFSTLLQCWRICIHETDLNRYIKKDITVLHPLGLVAGTRLWLEEVVNRYYFSTINSFVYLGAALLLVLIGIRRYSDSIDDWVVISGIAFESLMLILMFFVMIFTPNQDVSEIHNSSEDGALGDLLTEIGEISRDFAASSLQLEQLGNSLQMLIEKQNEMLIIMRTIAESNSHAVTPNPEMLEQMKQTNLLLVDFRNNLGALNEAAAEIKAEKIEHTVRKEMERMFSKIR